MIGKVILYGKDRNEAIGRMNDALAQIKISGLISNLPLLEAICKSEPFRSGNYNTQFLNTLHDVHV